MSSTLIFNPITVLFVGCFLALACLAFLPNARVAELRLIVPAQDWLLARVHSCLLFARRRENIVRLMIPLDWRVLSYQCYRCSLNADDVCDCPSVITVQIADAWLQFVGAFIAFIGGVKVTVAFHE